MTDGFSQPLWNVLYILLNLTWLFVDVDVLLPERHRVDLVDVTERAQHFLHLKTQRAKWVINHCWKTNTTYYCTSKLKGAVVLYMARLKGYAQVA